MATNGEQGTNISFNVPIGLLGVALLAALASAAYMMTSNQEEATESPAASMTRSAKGGLKKLGLLGLASMIENDATRKVVVAILRAMAKRS